MNDTFTIHTDGGSRGNPGPAGYAYIIERPGESDIEEKAFLGSTTNNIAEYTALVRALEHAQELGGKRLVIHSDSELLVQQMNGKYKVKNAGLLPLYEQASKLVRSFDHVVIRHIYRESNKRADRLCNEAMDERTEERIRASDFQGPASRPMPQSPAAPLAKPAAAPKPASKPSLRDEAIGLLRSAQRDWADDADDAPTPEEVWNKLWEMVQRSAAK